SPSPHPSPLRGEGADCGSPRAVRQPGKGIRADSVICSWTMGGTYARVARDRIGLRHRRRRGRSRGIQGGEFRRAEASDRQGRLGSVFKAVEQQSNGSLKFRQFLAGSLLEAKGLLGGVRDGVADVGQVTLTYHPAEFPHAQLVADFALYGGDAMVVAAAVTEFNLFHCPPCLAE